MYVRSIIDFARGRTEARGCLSLQQLQTTDREFGISAYFDENAVREKTDEMVRYAFHYDVQNVDHQRFFCAKCGTTLYWYLSDMPGLVGVAGGCFTDPPLGAPGKSSSHSQKLAWGKTAYRVVFPQR